jgi:hypothetical protein
MHISSLRVVRLSPALPGGLLGMRLHSATAILLRYGAASPNRLFASRLYLRQHVELLTASPQCSMSPTPWRSAPRQRERQKRHHRSPSLDGAALTIRRHRARQIVCASLHLSICVACEHDAPNDHRRTWVRIHTHLPQSKALHVGALVSGHAPMKAARMTRDATNRSLSYTVLSGPNTFHQRD